MSVYVQNLQCHNFGLTEEILLNILQNLSDKQLSASIKFNYISKLYGLYTNEKHIPFLCLLAMFFSLYFSPLEFEKVDYFLSSIWVSLVPNLIDGLLCNL